MGAGRYWGLRLACRFPAPSAAILGASALSVTPQSALPAAISLEGEDEDEPPQNRPVGSLAGRSGHGSDHTAGQPRGCDPGRLSGGLVLGQLPAELSSAGPAEGSSEWMPHRRRHSLQRDDLRQLAAVLHSAQRASCATGRNILCCSRFEEVSMHIAVIVLSVLLALEFAATGMMKVHETGTARGNAAHLGISLRLSRLIGIAELAAVAGLIGGLAFRPLAVVTAAAVILLMVGAVGSH